LNLGERVVAIAGGGIDSRESTHSSDLDYGPVSKFYRGRTALACVEEDAVSGDHGGEIY